MAQRICGIVSSVRSFLIAVVVLSACSRHPKIVLPGTQYRIMELDNRALTLAPPLERIPLDKPFSLQFPIIPGKAKQGCQESNDLFSIRIDRGKQLLLLQMPSLRDWQLLLNDWDKVDFKAIDQKVTAIANSPETLESRGCLSAGSAVELRRILLNSIPVRPGEDCFPSNGYRAGGLGFDVRAGMRLKVQRAHFQGPGRTIKELQGTSTIYYKAREVNGRLAFARPVVELDNDKLKALHLDSTIQAPPRPIYRLYFLTSFLKTGVRRSALVLGAPSVARMQAMERQISSNPAVGCEELDASACLSFEGDVSVSAEVLVTINGKRTWVDWGNSIASLLRKLKAEQATEIRLRRMFQGKLVPVDAPSPDMLTSTALVAGDELNFTLQRR